MQTNARQKTPPCSFPVAVGLRGLLRCVDGGVHRVGRGLHGVRGDEASSSHRRVQGDALGLRLPHLCLDVGHALGDRRHVLPDALALLLGDGLPSLSHGRADQHLQRGVLREGHAARALVERLGLQDLIPVRLYICVYIYIYICFM